MQTFSGPRQSGKSTKIARDVAWCSLFDILPVCVILCNFQMMKFFRTHYLGNEGITSEELKNIHLVVGATTWNNMFTSDIFSKIKTIKPVRIYIDEIQMFDKKFIDELQRRFDDKIYAYGTPAAEDLFRR
jgi:hypothetical protein